MSVIGQKLLVSEPEAGLRLEQLLRRRLPELSRGALQRMIADGLVRVDGRHEPRGARLRAGQCVELPLLTDERPLPQPDLPLEVLRVTPLWVAVNKPPGIPSHPLRAGETGTVANALVARFPECAEASSSKREGGLVHRLDGSTSGVLLAARSADAYRELRRRFSSGRVRKRYLALVAGALEGAGSIDVPLRAARGEPRRMEAVPAGSPEALRARSKYRALQQVGDFTWVSVKTRTGRRHQVRVHLAHLGFPLVGDMLYGGPPLEGLQGAFLHASWLELLPEGERIEAPLPEERRAILRALGFDPGAHSYRPGADLL